MFFVGKIANDTFAIQLPLFHMNDFNKFFGLTALIMGSFVSLLLLIVAIFYVLKLFAIVAINIPGTRTAFELVILLVPYLIYYASYYYLHKKIALAKTRLAQNLGWFFLATGVLVATACLALDAAAYVGQKNALIDALTSYHHYAFIAQVLFIFFTALSIASGDVKEKDWMERHKES
jgi:hypothetical protein